MTGYVLVCNDGRVFAVGRRGGIPGAAELRDAAVVEAGIPPYCGTAGAVIVTALNHPRGNTSGLALVCRGGWRTFVLGRQRRMI